MKLNTGLIVVILVCIAFWVAFIASMHYCVNHQCPKVYCDECLADCEHGYYEAMEKGE